ncbi:MULTISPECIES: hypothetical protein [unclassified Endozoicomonas]|uniref:hypothetical protein n=1 Tax=unclassified Endozoicomonas TaxID=2644528 RepID=UPI003BB5CE45
MQGFILKASSTDSHRKPARVDRQVSSSGIPDSSRNRFNGKRVYQTHKDTASALNDGKDIEDAFWQKKLLQGRQITPADVLSAYRNDTTSLRSGLFLERLCLKNILYNNQKVFPDQVIQEFNRKPNQNKYKLAIARFKSQCCIRGRLLHGQQVTPDVVVKEYQAAKASLELARFKQLCCLRGLLLNGHQVRPDAVVKDFPGSPEGKMALARFKAECCLRGLLLNGQQVTPDAVIKAYQAVSATLELARFKAACCFRGLPLNGQQVTPDAVIKAFPCSPQGNLGIGRFKVECCLRGLPLNDRPVTPEAVVKDYQAIKATLELARFKSECCLRGLRLNGKRISPDVVFKGYQDASAILEQARFKEACCLKGLLLEGQQVKPEAVVKGYQAARAVLDLTRFKERCCLNGVPLMGQQVTPDEVVKGYEEAKATLELPRFKQECCLRGLSLNGQPVTPDTVIKDFPDNSKGRLGMTRFKQECCLRGVALNGRLVEADAVVKDYEGGGWLMERAYFYVQLALTARELNGACLDNRQVLEVFNEVPGDHAVKQAGYLIQKLKQPMHYDENNAAQEILQEAWQILNNASHKDDEQQRLQCQLQFMAMHYGLSIDHQRVSAEQVLQSIKGLRNSFQSSRIHFFFLAHCCITRQLVNGRHVHKNQVLECLQRFSEGSKMRHALGFWFEQCSCEANIMDNMLFKRENTVVRGSDSHQECSACDSQAEASVAVSREHPGSPEQFTDNAWFGCFSTDVNGCSANLDKGGPLSCQVTYLNSITLKTLEIIQEINNSYTDPPILVTGSYARFLQNLHSSFDEIDIICTKEASVRTLFDKLQALNTDSESDIPQSVIIWPVPECQAMKLPKAYSIDLKDGDLGVKAMGFQVYVDARVTDGKASRLPVLVPGVERPVWCLLFAEETRLLNDTLQYLTDNLDQLTEQLHKGAAFDLPQTILFHNPQNTGERIYGLLIGCLLILNKAKQFIALHSEGKPGCRPNQLQEEYQRLHALTESLQMKLTHHVCRHDFEFRVNDWLSKTRPLNECEVKSREAVEELLALMKPA